MPTKTRIVAAELQSYDLVPSIEGTNINIAIGVLVDDSGRTGFDQSEADNPLFSLLTERRVLWQWEKASPLELTNSAVSERILRVRQNACPFAVVVEATARSVLEGVNSQCIQLRKRQLAKKYGKLDRELICLSPLSECLLESRCITLRALEELLTESPVVFLWLRRGGEYGLHCLVVTKGDLSGVFGLDCEWVSTAALLPEW